MGTLIVKEDNYKEQMDRIVTPYLQKRKAELWLERDGKRKLYCARYLTERARGVVLISHGFTETAEKYMECIYYFLKMGYHVYCIEHCGHGMSYRMTDDLSLVHIDKYERYVEDLIFAAKRAKQENEGMPLFLYAHSMGGGIGAAAAAKEPGMFDKLILTSPMIRPATRPVPWMAAKMIAEIFCAAGKEEKYVAGQRPYDGAEQFEESSSTSRARFEYYQEKRSNTPMYQMSAPSYGWLKSAGRLNAYLRSEGWKRIDVPVLLFQAEQEELVSKREQERFVRKMSRRGRVRLVRVPESKHEIFNAEDKIVEGYWKKIFAFLKETESGKEGEKLRYEYSNKL